LIEQWDINDDNPGYDEYGNRIIEEADEELEEEEDRSQPTEVPRRKTLLICGRTGTDPGQTWYIDKNKDYRELRETIPHQFDTPILKPRRQATQLKNKFTPIDYWNWIYPPDYFSNIARWTQRTAELEDAPPKVRFGESDIKIFFAIFLGMRYNSRMYH